MSEREKLFNKWKELGHRVGSLSGVVQNPIMLTEEQIKEWRNEALLYYNQVKELAGKTLHCLREGPALFDVYVHPESSCVYKRASYEDVRRAELEHSGGCVELVLSAVTEEEANERIEYYKVEFGYTE